jgi:hypothetical protein
MAFYRLLLYALLLMPGFIKVRGAANACVSLPHPHICMLVSQANCTPCALISLPTTQMVFFYFFSPRVLRSVPYGPGVSVANIAQSLTAWFVPVHQPSGSATAHFVFTLC